MDGQHPRNKLRVAESMFRLKRNRAPGICDMAGCGSEVVSPRSRWCYAHRLQVRTVQLRVAATEHRRRAKVGLAGHHVVYGDQPTTWAESNPLEAIRLAKRGRSVVDPDSLQQALVKG